MTTETLHFVDTHAHLDDDQFDADRAEVIAASFAAGVRRIINIGYAPAIWQRSIELSAAYPWIAYTLGIHPNHAEDATPENLAALRELVRGTKPVAIGEVGLDYYRDWADPAQQRIAFAAQIELAATAGLPLVIHQRHAEADFLAMMAEAPASLTFVLHSFDGSPKLMEAAIARGCPIGVGGLMTRSVSEALRSLLTQVPDELLLLETDSPYLKPASVRGTRNSPANLPRIAKALAELRGQTIGQIAAITSANAERIFGLAPVAAGAAA